MCASKLDFCTFEQYPEVALILYHLNRGVLHLKPLGDLKDENVKSDLVHNIEKEMLTDEEKLNLVKRFEKSQGRFCKIIGCGSCGIKEPQRGDDDSQYKEVKLTDLNVLEYKECDSYRLKESMKKEKTYIPMDKDGNWKEVDLWKIRSVYISNDDSDTTFYHLHPELVHYNSHNEESTHICPMCYKSIFDKGDIPELSVANGIDFGNFRRIGLTYPNPCERMILAKVCLYHKIFKIMSNNKKRNDFTHSKIRGHCINFGHNAPDLVSDHFLQHLDPEKMSEYLRIHFVGQNKKEMDLLIKDTLGTSVLSGRSFVVYQWMVVLKHVNPFYEGYELGDHEIVREKIEQINQKIYANRELVSTFDETMIGDDISNVRTISGSTSCCDIDQRPNDTCEYVEMETPSMPSFFVGSRNYNDNNSVQSMLRATAEAVGLNDIEATDKKNDFHKLMISNRIGSPLNEFTENDKLLCKSFPFIFILGKTYKTDKSLNSDQRHHLLKQFTNSAASTSEVMFFLYNQMA